MSTTPRSIQDSARTAVGDDALDHETVGHDGAAEHREQLRRILANPRRTRR